MISQPHPWELNADRVLVIPDFHQEVDWVKHVLNYEKDQYDHVVFLGDAFDSHKQDIYIASATKTAEFVRDVLRGTFGSFTYLVGNHDVAVIEASQSFYQNKTPQTLFNYCSGYTNNKAKAISKVLKREDWAKVELFKVVNGWLLSHAGLNADYFKPFKSVEENLIYLHDQSVQLNKCLYHDVHPLLQVGFARGGEHNYGSPIWADWDCEFEDHLDYRQLVGHSPTHNTIKQIGRSFCIDGSQTTYAFINRDGSTEWKNYRFETYYGNDLEPHLDVIPVPITIRNDDEHVKGRQNTTNQNLYQ